MSDNLPISNVVDGSQGVLDTTEGDKHVCLLCGKVMKSLGSLRKHKHESHDGSKNRIHPLKCSWCPSSFGSRPGLSKHLGRCTGLSELSYPLPCPHCGHECASVKQMCAHSCDCLSWKQDSDSEEQALVEFEKELVDITKHAATARCSQEIFEPAELRLEDGSRAFALLLTSGTKRLQSGSVAYVRPLKRRCESEVKDVELEVALKAHRYGGLVNGEDFKAAESGDGIWRMPFGSNGKSLARTLAGLLIQSGDAVLLALKVEVYGRLPSQDAQGQDVALPGRNPFSVVNSRHDNADKVMIGTLGWNALVTLAVILTNGKVVVGPHNPDFYPHRSSHVWVRKNGSEDSFNNLERQTRSKFHVQSTFETYAAACVEFNFYKTMPATLKTLWEYKINGVWSGVKAAAFVFYQLYTNHKLVKTEVERCVADAFAHNDRGCEILDAVNRMLAVMVDEEKVPVSKDVSKCLTEIAGRLQSEISDVNRGKVTKAVEKRIRMILEEPT